MCTQVGVGHRQSSRAMNPEDSGVQESFLCPRVTLVTRLVSGTCSVGTEPLWLGQPDWGCSRID